MKKRRSQRSISSSAQITPMKGEQGFISQFLGKMKEEREGDTMQPKKDKGHTQKEMVESLQKGNEMFFCPICGYPLHERNLLDKESVIYDMLYCEDGILICNSRLQLHCRFQHRYDEEGFTMDDPHELVGVVDTVFDQSGECIQFEVIEIRPAEKEVE